MQNVEPEQTPEVQTPNAQVRNPHGSGRPTNPVVVTKERLRELIAADAVYQQIGVREREYREKLKAKALAKPQADLAAFYKEIYATKREINKLQSKIRVIERKIYWAKYHASKHPKPPMRFSRQRNLRMKQLKALEAKRMMEEYRKELRRKLGIT